MQKNYRLYFDQEQSVTNLILLGNMVNCILSKMVYQMSLIVLP